MHPDDTQKFLASLCGKHVLPFFISLPVKSAVFSQKWKFILFRLKAKWKWNNSISAWKDLCNTCAAIKHVKMSCLNANKKTKQFWKSLKWSKLKFSLSVFCSLNKIITFYTDKQNESASLLQKVWSKSKREVAFHTISLRVNDLSDKTVVMVSL